MTAPHATHAAARAPRDDGTGSAAAVILPAPASHYSRRAARLAALAAGGHPMADYLRLAEAIVLAQQAVLAQAPWRGSAGPVPTDDAPPLAPQAVLSDGDWRTALTVLCETLRDAAALPAPARAATQALLASPAEALRAQAEHLCAGAFERVDSARAVFLWAALSVSWTQRAAALAQTGWQPRGGPRPHCPACGGAPVASVVLDGAQAALRYLHCSLCETRWHRVRSQCTNCDATGQLDYWSLETETAAIKAESCGDCHSYLKVLYLERDRHMDAFADDLASLALDADVERQGYGRSGINPFLLPGHAGAPG